MENDNINKTTISDKIELNNGTMMPRIGLGTAQQQNLPDVIYESIKHGLRMIDTAERYGNEKEVGEGIKQAIKDGLVKREDLFIVTKLMISRKHEAEEAIKSQLKTLQLDYVDLYLDHWPFSIYRTGTNFDGDIKSTPLHILWKNMEDLVKKGYTKSIGVSNYNVQSLMNLLSFCEIKPVVNQVEYHPYLQQKNLNKYCRNNGIVLTAFNSLTRGSYVHMDTHKSKNLNILEEKLINDIAGKYNKSPGQVALNWALAQDVIVIPASSNPLRIKENLGALTFKLSDDEMETLESLNLNYRFNPSTQWPYSMGYDIFA